MLDVCIFVLGPGEGDQKSRRGERVDGLREREQENDVKFSLKNTCTVRVKREETPLRCTPHKL